MATEMTDERTEADVGQETLPVLRKAELVAGEKGYIVPRTVEEAMRMAKAVVAGRLAPSSYDGDEYKVMLGLMAAMEAGLPPLYGLRQIAIIQGRPVIWGDAGMALIQSSGNLSNQEVEWHIPEGFDPNATEVSKWPNDYGVTVRLWRRGQESPYEGSFTVGDAKRAHLWIGTFTAKPKAPWIEHPRRMLFIRARTTPQKEGFADALAGLAIREEVEDTFGEDGQNNTVDAGFLKNEGAVEAPPMPEDE